jgi:superfamily II DNA or RNA helicase
MPVSTLALEMPAPSLPLRPYQAQAIEAIGAAEARGVTRPLVVLPTGGGKTVVFSHLVTQRPGRSLILAHRDELISQAAAKLTAVSGSLDIGIVKAAQDDTGARVVVASVQTLAKAGRLERLGRFSTVIVDEAHHAVARIYLNILERLGCMADNGALTVGFTATAGRSDKVGLGAVWQEIAYQRGIVQMIAEGYLCDVKAMQIGGDFNLENAKVRAGDYTDASLAAELERSDAINAAADAYVRYAKDRLGVAFTPTIATAHALAAALTRKGIRAEAVDGEMPLEQRRAILGRLHRGETRVVPNAQVLTEGWDEPAVSCALMLRPTKSAPFFVQMAGRVLRPFIGTLGGRPYSKEDALILDCSGSAEQLGLATIADLAGLPPGSVKEGKSLLDAADASAQLEKLKYAVAMAKTRQVELLRRSDLRWLDADGSWVLPVGDGQVMILVPLPSDGTGDEWHVWRSQKGADPVLESGKPLTLDWARGVGEEVARAQGSKLSNANADWRQRRASDAQQAALARMGYGDKLAGLTRGGASDLMTVHDAVKVIRRLRKGGAR